MMAFDILFKTNVSLPNYIGLGKGASTGFGMVVQKREPKENQ
jgi:CRISPR/Cas system endoribonuclease Cas6 (RAMP superfamily)